MTHNEWEGSEEAAKPKNFNKQTIEAPRVRYEQSVRVVTIRTSLGWQRALYSVRAANEPQPDRFSDGLQTKGSSKTRTDRFLCPPFFLATLLLRPGRTA